MPTTRICVRCWKWHGSVAPVSLGRNGKNDHSLLSTVMNVRNVTKVSQSDSNKSKRSSLTFDGNPQIALNLLGSHNSKPGTETEKGIKRCSKAWQEYIEIGFHVRTLWYRTRKSKCSIYCRILQSLVVAKNSRILVFVVVLELSSEQAVEIARLCLSVRTVTLLLYGTLYSCR